MDWCSENVQQNQNKEEKGLAAAAGVTQAARDRKAGCLPPFIGQSGQSGASAAKKEEPNCPSGNTAPRTAMVRPGGRNTTQACILPTQ